MRKRTLNPSYAFPMMMARLAAASWETILRRTLMMAQGTCTPAEYRRMAAEKVAAMQFSTAALMRGCKIARNSDPLRGVFRVQKSPL